MVKNLNDVIHGDRAIVRADKKKAAALSAPKTTGGSVTNIWSGSTSSYEKCAHSHPALKLPGSDKVIYGGACSDPVVKDADIYIALCGSWSPTQRSWPWKKGTEFMFSIPDMGIPKLPEEFVKLVDWTKKQIDEGKKIHVGCIGGHGRTGMLFSALVSRYGEADAISYVRANYCERAVESARQVEFLQQWFGIKKAVGYKENWGKKTNGKGSKGLDYPTKGMVATYKPITGAQTIWGHTSKGAK